MSSDKGFRDYFQILGVERNASSDSIKRAFRKLARKYHPDVNPGDSQAEAKFKEISEAYEVLSDPDKKRKYEQFGQYWSGNNNSPGPGFDVDYGNFDDFINDLLGRFSVSRGSSGFPGGFQGVVGNRTTSANQVLNLDAEVKIQISFSEAFHGTERTLSVNKERVQVQIPGGVRSGSKLRLKGKGNSQPGIGKRGDLFLVIEIKSHSIWRLEGDQLRADLPVSFHELALGSTIPVSTPDGEAQLNIPPRSLPGINLRLKGKGWPLKGGRGDLIFTLIMSMPSQWTSEELNLLKQFEDVKCHDPRGSWLQDSQI